MAGSAMTFEYDDGSDRRGRPCNVCKVIVAWTSDDTTGAVSGTTEKIVGKLLKAITDPGATAPTDNYDIAITDSEGVDVLAGCASTLANRDTANTEEVYFVYTDAALQPSPVVVCDPLTISITNAGNSKVGQLILFYSPL